MAEGELGQQTVELGAVVRRAAEESYLSLRELVEKSQDEGEGKGGAYGARQRSDSEKKIDLLKFIARTRQRMLRLHVLAKWCQQVRVSSHFILLLPFTDVLLVCNGMWIIGWVNS